jgi:Holliday junction resolvase RusA-like endonuclease
MKVVRFEVPGYVQPKQRTFGKGWITPPETRAYEKLVRQMALLAMKGSKPFDGFIGLEIEIICEVPKSWSKKKAAFALEGRLFPTHCDIDNQVKALCDGMNRALYTDDRFVNHLLVRREYGQKDIAIVTARSLGYAV